MGVSQERASEENRMDVVKGGSETRDLNTLIMS